MSDTILRTIKSALIAEFADYWDSFWIVEGLIQSELLDVANETLQNFMDELEDFGFIPNGGRIYCKRRHRHVLQVPLIE